MALARVAMVVDRGAMAVARGARRNFFSRSLW
jgi:hypothetical protein